MTTLSKEQVVEKIKEIVVMSESELESFIKKLSLSNIDDKAKKFFYKAIDLRREMLKEREKFLAQNGDLDDIFFDQKKWFEIG